MPNIKIRISEDERDMLRHYSEFFGKPMTACVRDAFLKEYKKNMNKIEYFVMTKEDNC